MDNVLENLYISAVKWYVSDVPRNFIFNLFSQYFDFLGNDGQGVSFLYEINISEVPGKKCFFVHNSHTPSHFGFFVVIVKWDYNFW